MEFGCHGHILLAQGLVLAFVLRDLIHFELIFARGKGPTSFFCMSISSFNVTC